MIAGRKTEDRSDFEFQDSANSCMAPDAEPMLRSTVICKGDTEVTGGCLHRQKGRRKEEIRPQGGDNADAEIC